MQLPSPRISSIPPHSDLQGVLEINKKVQCCVHRCGKNKSPTFLSFRLFQPLFKIMRRNSPQFDLPSYTCISSSIARKELLYMHFCSMICYHFLARPNSVCFLWRKWFRQWHEHHIQFLENWASRGLKKSEAEENRWFVLSTSVYTTLNVFFIYFSHPQYVRLNYRKAMYVLTSKSVFTQT